jgi:hypothetical protein
VSIELHEALHRIADQARTASLPPDLWTRGRRQHRRRVLAAATAVVLVALAALVPLTAGWRSHPVSPAHNQPSVPSTVDAPLPFQSTVQDAPPGAATLLLTGVGGFDLSGDGDRALVVGATGQYRWLRHANAFDAGESVLLSPDGRYVAGDGGVEGGAVGDGLLMDFTVVVDLATGNARTFHAGYPLGWSPDGRTLLTSQDNRLRILSVDSGAVVSTGIDLGTITPIALAFAPDGRRVVLQAGGELRIVDLATRTQRTLVRLGGYRVLAGPGAWRPDGTIAVWDWESMPAAGTLLFSMSYVDSTYGIDVAGPYLGGFGALGARLLGWRSNGDAVVVRYEPVAGEPPPVHAEPQSPAGGRAELVGINATATYRLVALPGGTNRVDVAAQLLDRFGGPSPSTGYRLADWLRTHLDDLFGLVAAVAVVTGVVVLRRRFRQRQIRSGRHPSR